MGGLIGAKEYDKFSRGEKLTRKEAMLAQCYDCNGCHESSGIGISKDCLGKSCPMYQYMPYRGL